MSQGEQLRSRFLQQNSGLDIEQPTSPLNETLHFALMSNGYVKDKTQGWQLYPDTISAIANEFGGLRTAFYGPGGHGPIFEGRGILDAIVIRQAFRDDVVLDTVQKYREIDEDLGIKVAFMLGGLVRDLRIRNNPVDDFTLPISPKEIDNVAMAVNFAARMARLAGPESVEAVVSALAMYYSSGGSIEYDNHFAGQIYHMTEAIADDPVIPLTTTDLGLSQVARLRSYGQRIADEEPTRLPDISSEMLSLFGYPTVGAEFHFTLDDATKHPQFLQRLALLNMSQFQPGSFIQFSRNDRGVFEVRMNPSVYPITLANWKHMKFILPELAQAYFTFTMNRTGIDTDFSWTNNRDEKIIRQLAGLGLLCYAASYQNVPPATREEINFGTVYLGQTVRLNQGDKERYRFTGNWSGNEGQYGQIGIYTGFGNNMPYLGPYLSHVFMLNDPTKFPSLRRIDSIGDAMRLSSSQRRDILTSIQREVMYSPQTRPAVDAGIRMLEKLAT